MSEAAVLIITEESWAQKGNHQLKDTQEKVEGWAPNTGRHLLQHLLLPCTKTWGPTGLPAVLTNWIRRLHLLPEKQLGVRVPVTSRQASSTEFKGKVGAKSFGCAI